MFKIYVPVGTPAEQLIARGSAVVGRGDVSEGRTLVYYEGNLYGAQNMRVFADRVTHAAGRMREAYPTIAKALLPIESLREVGVGDLSSLTLTFINDREALQDWLESEELPLASGERWIPGREVWEETVAAGGYRWINVLDARGNIVARVQVDEDDAEQTANLAKVIAAPRLFSALQIAEAFMSGFEDDECQEGMAGKLATIRAALLCARETPGPR